MEEPSSQLFVRLNEAEAEIKRLRGEFSAARNVFASIIRDTLLARPEVGIGIRKSLNDEIARLDKVTDGDPLLKEGAKRFYRKFSRQIADASKPEEG